MDRLSDYDFDLPESLIAQYPTERRDGSRLLVIDRRAGSVTHHTFTDLPSMLSTGDCLVLNDTRVRSARLLGTRPTGGKAEILLLRPLSEGLWEALGRPIAKLRPGTRIDFDPSGAGRLCAEVIERHAEGICHVRLHCVGDLDAMLDQLGHVPLPPYIRRADDPDVDRDRYQTIYAENTGAVAAPTAGLHFSHGVLADLESRGVNVARITLHVGLGTFRPVAVEDLDSHIMHSEEFTLPAEAAEEIRGCRDAGGRVVAVGTTCVRTLESCANGGGGVRQSDGATNLFIRPGFSFQVVDALLTNFHLPRSTLLMLVSAFAGYELTREAYRTAVEQEYRFFSYGDAMLIV